MAESTLSPQQMDEFINGVADVVFGKISTASGDNLDLVQTMLWHVAETMVNAAALTALEQGGAGLMESKVDAFKARIDEQIQMFKSQQG